MSTFSYDLPEVIRAFRYTVPEEGYVFKKATWAEPMPSVPVETRLLVKRWYRFERPCSGGYAWRMDNLFTTEGVKVSSWLMPGWWCEACKTTFFVDDWQELTRHFCGAIEE